MSAPEEEKKRGGKTGACSANMPALKYHCAARRRFLQKISIKAPPILRYYAYRIYHG